MAYNLTVELDETYRKRIRYMKKRMGFRSTKELVRFIIDEKMSKM